DRLTTGLWLAVGKPTKTGKVSKSWVFRYVPPVEAGTVAVRGAGNTAGRNKPRAMGLGSFPEIGVATARDKAEEARKKIAAGIDPLEERKREKIAVKAMTFAEAVAAYLEAKV